MPLDIQDFTYPFDQSLIANHPASPRDHSRLMLVDRQTQQISHQYFYDITDFLKPGDVLVLNETKVFPARIFAKKETGGKLELLLLRQLKDNVWLAISKPGLREGQKVIFDKNFTAQVAARYQDSAELELAFNLSGQDLLLAIDRLGFTPIPPYIKSSHQESKLRREYQTVYAKYRGSAAAPTAGLHFTKQLLAKIKNKGVQIEKVTLHVGLGTFKPVTAQNLEEKKLHREEYQIDEATAHRLNTAKQNGQRIIAVGTTSTRTLESAIGEKGLLKAGQAETNIFIYPPYQFKFVNALITNFHLPKSSLLMLVSALVTAPNTAQKFTQFKHTLIGRAYHQAVENQYRFFSFGDAMFIV